MPLGGINIMDLISNPTILNDTGPLLRRMVRHERAAY